MKNKEIKRVYAILIVATLSLATFSLFFQTPQTRAASYHPAMLTVFVEYANHTPAVDAEVTLLSLYNPNVYTRDRTDSAGKVTFSYLGNIYWGRCAVNAIDGDRQEIGGVNVTLLPDDVKSVTITLHPIPESTNTLRGTVVDITNSTPIADATFELTLLLPHRISYTLSTRTTPSGGYVINFPSTTSVILISISHPDYSQYQAKFFWYSGRSEYIHNARMKPREVAYTTLLEAVVYNPYTGERLGGSLTLQGNSATLDHASVSHIFRYNSTGSYYYVWAGAGEYEIRYYRYKDYTWNVSYTAEYPVYINATDTLIRANMSVPIYERMRNVYVKVGNSTGPLNYANIRYEKREEIPPLIYYDIYGDTHTNSSGMGHLGIPPGETIELSISASDHDYTRVTIPAGDIDDDVHINVTLRERVEPGPTGEISILVRDTNTGIPMPSVYVRGEGVNGEGDNIYFSGRTGSDGYLNKTVPAGRYTLMYAEAPLGYAEIKNVTVEPAGTLELTLTLQLWEEEEPQMVDAVIEIVDESGAPIPGVWMRLSGEELPVTYFRSDEGGLLHFRLLPGEYRAQPLPYSTPERYRAHWHFNSVTFSVNETGENRLRIVAYRAYPLTGICGIVMEKGTKRPLQGVYIGADSRHVIDRTRNGVESPDGYDYVSLYHQSVYTDERGFYRVWGVDRVNLYVNKAGYFPLSLELDLSTRGAEVEMNLYLEPMPESTAWISGSLVDEDLNPISGYVIIYDPLHDYSVTEEYPVNETGVFNISVYPGDFEIYFGNDTLSDSITVNVPEEGLSGLVLKLVPKATISGKVYYWNHTPAAGINVTLVEGTEIVDWYITGEDGSYHFRVPRGEYILIIGGTPGYSSYISPPLITDGWVDITHDVVLQNITHGNVMVTVIGEGGPYHSVGIEGAVVRLVKGNVTYLTSITGPSGNTTFSTVLFGEYTVEVDPPDNMRYTEGLRSGYLPNYTVTLNLDRYSVEVVVHLIYAEVPFMVYLNITGYGPTGDSVPIDSVIWISFSMPVNRSSAEGALTVNPTPDNLSISWEDGGRKMVVHHSNLLPGTTYSVTLSGTVLSEEGYPLWNYEGISWSFITGEGVSPWRLDSAEVVAGADRSVSVSAAGRENLTVYIVIEGVGSFRLTETSPGEYYVAIPGENFDWNTTYRYHFSNVSGGEDMAPHLSGEFTTPENPSSGGGITKKGKEGNIALYIGILLLALIIIGAAIYLRKGMKGVEMEE